jgi:hypothetical protein
VLSFIIIGYLQKTELLYLNKRGDAEEDVCIALASVT